MSIPRSRPTFVLLLPALSAALLVGLSTPRQAFAQRFATPPGGGSSSSLYSSSTSSSSWSFLETDTRLGFMRLSVGPALKFDVAGVDPGLGLSLDLGRGPAGFRMTGAWLNVGTETGLSQYTGELTIDFGGRSLLRPVIGAGGGVARTSSSMRADGALDMETGAWLGIGVVRAGLGVRLPFEATDARVALDVTGSFPAIRGSNAPDQGPWALTSITVTLGWF